MKDLTKREHAAIKIMAGFAANPSLIAKPDYLANLAYDWADATLSPIKNKPKKCTESLINMVLDFCGVPENNQDIKQSEMNGMYEAALMAAKEVGLLPPKQEPTQ
jgi:hypothetical protein